LRIADWIAECRIAAALNSERRNCQAEPWKRSYRRGRFAAHPYYDPIPQLSATPKSKFRGAPMRKVVVVSPALIALSFLALATASFAQSSARVSAAAARRGGEAGVSRVIVMAADPTGADAAAAAVQRAGGRVVRSLPIISGYAAELPNQAIVALAANRSVARVTLDHIVSATMERTAATVGARAVRAELGYDGSGIRVAIVDSGIASWHDDLGDGNGAQRVDRFVDFVNGRTAPYDDYGHGTHVAGIITGNGADSGGARAGIAPNARVVALKVLDQSGSGRSSDVIAALDYVLANRAALNIRIVNLSIATGVYDSYDVDPLTLAARRLVDAGIVVVAAAGNYGRGPDGRTMYGGVTAPGNAPWVLTVGASSHMGTVDRADDTVATFSSRGPAAIDAAAKPDLVAPGVGIESLSDPQSAWYSTQAQFLLAGTAATSYLPYLSQSGTSMSTPVVTGAVALMLQANPGLTPNAVKAILQYTAQIYAQYDPLTEGAGFLNAAGAVALARYFSSPSGERPTGPDWSGHLIWGNRMISGGRLTADANAWSTTVKWGAAVTPAGQAVGWGEICRFDSCDTGAHQWSRWRITCDACSDSKWSNGDARNVVWGGLCGGANCDQPWSLSLFTATTTGDTVVWGTGQDGDTVVWGTSGDGDTVVWGTGEGDTVVWGTACADSSCTAVVWSR
jgi:serine protease AprX